jgi:hypothetical protein
VIALGLPEQLPPIAKGVRLHVIGRRCLQPNVPGELRIVEGSEILLHINPKAPRSFRDLFDKFRSRYSKAMETRSRVDPGGRLRASMLHPANRDRDSLPVASDCRCDKAEPLANRRRVPQRRASCGQHPRQDKPLERPGGAGALVLMNEALMLAASSVELNRASVTRISAPTGFDLCAIADEARLRRA